MFHGCIFYTRDLQTVVMMSAIRAIFPIQEGTFMDRNQKEALAMRVSVVTILGNLALTIFKLAAGVLAHSGAMAGVKLSGQESD